jgi:putative selenate reductase FAD-binding subunit
LGFRKQAEYLIHLDNLGLNGIAERGDQLIIGACSVMQDLLESELVYTPLKRAVQNIANRNIRNMASLGGHIVANKSCADVIPALLVLEAELVLLTASGKLKLSVWEYIQQPREGLVLEIAIPRPTSTRLISLQNFSRTASDISILTAAVSLDKTDNRIQRPLIAVGGVAPYVRLLTGVSEQLDNCQLPSREQIAAIVAEHIEPISDLRGSAEFKRYMAGVLVASALHTAWNGAAK